jgi:hypothetical protein
MNRRDLILGSALGLAAAGAATQGQAQASKAKAAAAPAGAPKGVYIPSNYGYALTIPFTTSTDLQAFMPPGLTVVDPHKAFIKAERIKLRSPETDGMPAAFGHYHQLCITTMATTPQFGPRQRNILMWEDRAWAVGGSMLAVKRWGDVQMTEIFDMDRQLVAQGTAVPFHVEVWQNGTSLMSFSGELDGKARVQNPPYPGFYVGGDPGQDLLAMDLAASSFSREMHGTGTVKFGTLPGQTAPAGPGKGWSASLLKDIQVQGAIFHDFSFTRARGSEFHTVRKALPGNGRSRL